MFGLCAISTVFDIIEMSLDSTKSCGGYYGYNYWGCTMSFGLGLWCVVFSWVSASLVFCASKREEPYCLFLTEIVISNFAITCTLMAFIWSVTIMAVMRWDLFANYPPSTARAILFCESLVAISNFGLFILSIISSANACGYVCTCCGSCCDGGCGGCCGDDVVPVSNTVAPLQATGYLNPAPVYAQQPLPINTTGQYYPVQGTAPMKGGVPVQGYVPVQAGVPVQGVAPYPPGQVVYQNQPVNPVSVPTTMPMQQPVQTAQPNYVMPAIPEVPITTSMPQAGVPTSTIPTGEPPVYEEAC